MPTGYTAALCERDVPFDKFVWTCARAFGALISMRDDGLDAAIPARFGPSTYSQEQVRTLTVELKRLKGMSKQECAAEMERENAEHLAANEKYVAECAAKRERLMKMRNQVDAWKPPSADHFELKRFMQEQIDSTIRCDGKASTFHLELITHGTPEDWRRSKMNECSQSIAYHEEAQREENERVAGRNLWLARLHESLRVEGEVGT